MEESDTPNIYRVLSVRSAAMKQGWTVTFVLVETPMRPEDPYDDKDMRRAMRKFLECLPHELRYQQMYISQHKTRLQK